MSSRWKNQRNVLDVADSIPSSQPFFI